MGTQNGHTAPFLEPVSLKKGKRKVMLSNKTVVINLPFEGRKVEGSRKNRRWERVPRAGSRREEAIIEFRCKKSSATYRTRVK